MAEKQNMNRQEVMNAIKSGISNAMFDYRNRDDLRVRTVAKNKAVNMHDVILYDELDAGKIDLARTKGLAF